MVHIFSSYKFLKFKNLSNNKKLFFLLLFIAAVLYVFYTSSFGCALQT